MRAVFLATGLALALAGCATKQPYADDATIAAVSYRDPGPAKLTLITMINNRTGRGGHSALMINASERVIFDPAGSFYLDQVPERNDVLFGITPAIYQGYRSAHSRSTFHVLSQEIEVTPEQAEIAYQKALRIGPISPVFCADGTSRLLKQVPGFEGLAGSMYPTVLAKQFGALTGVVEDRYYEDDTPDLDWALQELNNQSSDSQ